MDAMAHLDMVPGATPVLTTGAPDGWHQSPERLEIRRRALHEFYLQRHGGTDILPEDTKDFEGLVAIGPKYDANFNDPKLERGLFRRSTDLRRKLGLYISTADPSKEPKEKYKRGKFRWGQAYRKSVEKDEGDEQYED